MTSIGCVRAFAVPLLGAVPLVSPDRADSWNPDPRRAKGVLSDLDGLERALAAAVGDGSRDAYGLRIRAILEELDILSRPDRAAWFALFKTGHLPS